MGDANRDFLNLPFQEKLEFLYGLPARQKRDLILAAPEAARLVQSFSPETLFYTLKEIGVADAGDLLSLAIPEQVRWLFDLDCWDKDRPNLYRMREWIEAMAEGGRERVTDGLMSADLELVSLLLRQHIKVHRIDEPQENTDAPSDRFIQFGDHYLIEFTRRDSIQPYLLEFLEEAFERDFNYFTALMEEIYWGVEAELEEQAYQFRCARLADHGFPDFYEAQAVFAYLEPAQFLKLREQYTPPLRDYDEPNGAALPPDLAPLAPETDNSLFNLALTAGFAAQGARQVRSEMALVTNQVLVAKGIDFGDPDAVREAVGMTHDYLNLALEHLAGGELETAIEHLRATHLQLLFRLGVSLTIDLRTRAEQVMARMGLGRTRPREVPYLDSPYRETLAAMLQRQPRFFSGLESPRDSETRGFRTMRDLHLCYAMLDQLDAVRDLFVALLGLDIAAAAFRASIAGHEIKLSQILLTAFAGNALHGGAIRFTPLDASSLTAARQLMMTPGRPARLRDDFAEALRERLAQQVDPAILKRATPFIESCLKMFEEEFAELDPEAPIDPRFIRSLLVRQ